MSRFSAAATPLLFVVTVTGLLITGVIHVASAAGATGTRIGAVHASDGQAACPYAHRSPELAEDDSS